jgi:hypothetical protein
LAAILSFVAAIEDFSRYTLFIERGIRYTANHLGLVNRVLAVMSLSSSLQMPFRCPM